MVLALTFTPYAAATSVIPVIVAGALGNWPAFGLGLVVLADYACVVAPRAVRTGGTPAGDDPSPRLRVLTANLWLGRADATAVVELVRRTGADVLGVQELTPELAAALDAAGLAEEMPHRQVEARRGASGTALYARHPITTLPGGADTVHARVEAEVKVPGTAPIRYSAVHPPAPLRGMAGRWAADLASLPATAGTGGPGGTDAPVHIVAGDFNATLDHARLRELISRGYRDAAAASGRGLERTFLTGPPITIDHILTDRRCRVTEVRAHEVRGSDHRALFAVVHLP
jgi:endonuclease/exonuclease/phosphatase (EEP) superfamily protein YafD